MYDLKTCKICRTTKKITEFNKRAASKDGLDTKCRECYNKNKEILSGVKIKCSNCKKKKPEERFTKKQDTCNTCFDIAEAEELLKTGQKLCPTCKNVKITDEFGFRSDTRDKLRNQCKECEKVTRSKYVPQLIDNLPENKVCSKCKINKPITEYHKSPDSIIGVRSDCKICVKIYTDNFRKDNPYQKRDLSSEERDELNTKRRYYRNKNKEVLSAKNREYYSKNKDKAVNYRKTYFSKNRERLNEIEKDRMKNDLSFRLRKRLGNTIRNCFRGACEGNFKKANKTVNILNCSLLFFKGHIEDQFLDWMNWENHGNCKTNEFNCTFDFDHIIPISYAKTEEEIYLLNHWSNFQPLCSKVNRDIKKAIVYPCSNLELGITFWENRWEYT